MAPVQEDKILKEVVDKVSNNDNAAAQQIISQNSIDPNTVDDHGMSLLQHAAYKGNWHMVRALIDQGADVNGGKHEHQYSTLHFAALSGKPEVCEILLDYGAKINVTNSVGRTPAQMAAFVGNHSCVAVINNYISKSEVDYYTEPSGLETEPKLSPMLSEPLHKFITGTNVYPVKIAMNLRKLFLPGEQWEQIGKVLDLMSERQMKLAMETNEIMSFKLHYFSRVVEEVVKTKKNQIAQHENKPTTNDEKAESEEGSKKCDAIELFIKKMLRVNRKGDTPDQDSFLVNCVRSFHARDCAIFRQMVSTLARADAPEPITVITGTINGHRAFADHSTECWTCGENEAFKKCSKCKNVRYCDRECQRLHWFVHKKQCNRPTTSHETGKKIDPCDVQSAVESTVKGLSATNIN